MASNFSSNVSRPYEPLEATLIGVTGGLLSYITAMGNVMVMISFKMDKQLQTISNYFLFSLAVADFIIGIISMPLYTMFIIQRKWTLGDSICDAWLSVDYLASNASVMNLIVISFDRYFSVTRPLTYRARRTTRKAALMIFSAWAISAIVWPPSILAWPYLEGGRTIPSDECYIQFIYSNEYISILTVMIAFFIPVSIMIGLYVRVWWETVKRQKDLVHLTAGKNSRSKKSNSSDEMFGEQCKNQWKDNHGAKRTQQEITYVPTSILKRHTSLINQISEEEEQSRWWNGGCYRLCIDGSGNGDEPSSEGYITPRSIETPVQINSKCSSLNIIRDPYASSKYSRHHINDLEPLKTQPKEKDELLDTNDIYTILIRLPSKVETSSSSNTVASIQMLTDKPEYPKSLPLVRRLPPSSSKNDLNTIDDVAKLNFDSGLLRSLGTKSKIAVKRTQSAQSDTVTIVSPVSTLQRMARKPGKTKKTNEKKQDRKAAKTLSAILLAFIITWTPYSVLTVINSILGKQTADEYIPTALWDFAYYLCYINSTINPVLYALCNAAFRRTYVRILTCRWGSRARQPVNRYYYG